MWRSLLSLALAVTLGITLMLVPLLLLHADMETISRAKPELPKSLTLLNRSESAEISVTPLSPSAEINWLEIISTVVLGAIPAATISILIKRKLKI